MATKPGHVEVSFAYSRPVGPKQIHGAVTLMFAPADRYSFNSEATWPGTDNFTQAVESAVSEVLALRGVLSATSVLLKSVEWDGVNSCELGFRAAARPAAEAAFEV
jgi:hypothetical protein